MPAKRVDYSTSKSAMYGFMKALCRELGDYLIRINCIAPGMIMTDMLRNNDPEILKANTAAQCLHFIAEPVEICRRHELSEPCPVCRWTGPGRQRRLVHVR